MAGGLLVEVDARQVGALADELGATEAQLEAALKSAYGRMARWLRTRAVRGLSAHLGVQQKILRGRIRTFRLQGGVSTGGDGAKVWFGLQPISLMRLGARQTAQGVRAGGRMYPGAFIATVNGRRGVYRRVGKERVPLEAVTLDISDKALTYVEDELIGTAEFDAQLQKFIEHEIRWRTRLLR
jgi:Prophage minor tail protein Z (GPZ).